MKIKLPKYIFVICVFFVELLVCLFGVFLVFVYSLNSGVLITKIPNNIRFV